MDRSNDTARDMAPSIEIVQVVAQVEDMKDICLLAPPRPIKQELSGGIVGISCRPSSDY
jgi:hypothetical protein